MKRKISVRLSEAVVERLEATAKRPGASKTKIVESAIDRFLDPGAETIDDATLLRRLDGMSRQLEQLEHDLRIVNETVAFHARYHLAVTPPLPQSQQPAACALGLERFEVFAAQVERRIHLGTPLMKETMERLALNNPNPVQRDIEEAAPLASPCADAEQDLPESTLVNGEQQLPAAAREDGSNRGFLEKRPNPLR